MGGRRLLFSMARNHILSQNEVKQKLISVSNSLKLDSNDHKIIKKFHVVEEQQKLAQECDKHAAVLVPLCFQGNKLSLLFTERSKDLKRNAGQISGEQTGLRFQSGPWHSAQNVLEQHSGTTALQYSFPGGQCDPSDKGVVHTALRETLEETGISKDSVAIWGELQAIPDRMLTTRIYPIIGFVNLKTATISINPQEVNKVFTIPLEQLCNSHSYTSFRIMKNKPSKRDYRTPVYLTNPRIWGLTALMTEMLIYKLLDGKTKLYRLPNRNNYFNKNIL